MQYICNEKGEKESVVIPVEEFEKYYHKIQFYSYTYQDVSAIGYWKEGSFYICKGSTIKGDLTGHASFMDSTKKKLDEFISAGTVVKEDNHYKVLADISTGKHSLAASLVAGGNKSGNESWSQIPENLIRLLIK